MRTYRIYLIRHAITQGNLDGKYVGSTDLPLCEEGVYELVQLMEKFEYPNVGAVYSSPLTRCLQTAKIIYRHHTPIVVDELREYDFGMYENKTVEELKDDPGFKTFLSDGFKSGPSGAEDMDDFAKRTLIGIERIVADMMKNKVSDAAVVAHGGVIMQILTACGLPKRNPLEWAVGNGKGYTLMINPSLWGNTRTAEVFTAIPYGDEETNVIVGYSDDQQSSDEAIEK